MKPHCSYYRYTVVARTGSRSSRGRPAVDARTHTAATQSRARELSSLRLIVARSLSGTAMRRAAVLSVREVSAPRIVARAAATSVAGPAHGAKCRCDLCSHTESSVSSRGQHGGSCRCGECVASQHDSTVTAQTDDSHHGIRGGSARFASPLRPSRQSIAMGRGSRHLIVGAFAQAKPMAAPPSMTHPIGCTYPCCAAAPAPHPSDCSCGQCA